MTTTNVRSLIDTTPVVEPLPLYTRRAIPDPETASIISSAPSYRSEAPPYTPPAEPLTLVATAPAATPQQQYGIPYRRYAPGFTPRLDGPVGSVANHNYNIASWSNMRTSGAVRQYENVARRRVERDCAAGLAQPFPTPPTHAPGAEGTAEASSSTSANTIDPLAIEEEPVSPLEDPALVGEAAAKAAKDARLYREKCMRGDMILKEENRSWDFMLGQMADWEERARSWNKFRDEVARGRRVKLAKRIGAMQRR